MATPFDLASDLYYHTATNNALQDLGRQGEVNAARMFELKAQANRAQLESRNRIGEIQAESQARGQLAAQESERVLNQQAQQKFAQAQQIDPSWKPDPDKTREQNAAAADNVGQQKTLQAYKATTDKLASERKNYYGMLDKLGLPKSIDQTRLGALVAQDPQFVNKLTPAQKDALSSGKVTVDQLVNSLNTGRFLGGLEGLATGVNPRDLASALATTAQTVRQNLQQEQQQLIQLKAGAAGQESLSRQNIYQQQASDLLKAIPPYMIGDAMSYANDKGIDDPGASLLNPDGTVKTLNPGGAQAAPMPPPVTDPNAAPPGTPPALDPKTYADQGALAANTHQLNYEQDQLTNKTAQLQALGGILNSGKYERKSAAFNPYLPQPASDSGSAVIPITPEIGTQLSQKYQKLNKEIEGHKKNIAERMFDDIRLRGAPPSPVQAPGVTPPPQQPAPQPQVPSFQPPSLTAPTNQPSAMNANPANGFQMMAVRNRLQQVFGTSDPNVLNAAKQLAKSQGATDDQLNQSLQAAMAGDPNAIANARKIISMVQQGNNGQIAAMPQSGYQGFGA